jgi:NTE family protein
MAKQRTIVADNVLYLVLEGGGGAGNAFPGALIALEDLSIMWNEGYKANGITGFAGSSAGAITALFLSLGYNSYELNYILTRQDFNEFFDDVKTSFVPRVGGCRTKNSTEYIEGEKAEIAANASTSEAIVSFMLKFLISPAYAVIAASAEPALEKLVFGVLLTLTADSPSKQAAVEQLSTGANQDQLYLSIKYDWGAFPGDAIRKFFAKWTTIAVWRRLGLAPGENIYVNGQKINPSELTFAQHKAMFGADLVITGSNLETGKTEYFSHYTTPSFPIVDAARISMSLPGAFKPLVLRSNQKADAAAGVTKGSFLEGVWVDGGLFNNDPVNVFDQIADSTEHTFSLRLRTDERTNIATYKDFFGAWPLAMAKGTGESQISTSFNKLSPLAAPLKRTLELKVDEDEMGLFDFAVDEATFDTVNLRSYNAPWNTLAPPNFPMVVRLLDPAARQFR